MRVQRTTYKAWAAHGRPDRPTRSTPRLELGRHAPTNGRKDFGYLCRFVEREGDARVPSGYAVDGYRLGQWVGAQRVACRIGKLDADRVARLDVRSGRFRTPIPVVSEHRFRGFRTPRSWRRVVLA